jgi:hypothetical protein
MIRAEFIGGKELLIALKDLGSEVAGNKSNVVLNSLHAAGRDVKKRMVEGAPISDKGTFIGTGENRERGERGRLKRSIRKFAEKAPHTLNEVVYVGPRAGKNRADPNGAWYAAIVEFQGGAGGVGKGYMQRSIDHLPDTRTIARSLGGSVARLAKKIGNENARAVGAKVKRANKARGTLGSERTRVR